MPWLMNCIKGLAPCNYFKRPVHQRLAAHDDPEESIDRDVSGYGRLYINGSLHMTTQTGNTYTFPVRYEGAVYHECTSIYRNLARCGTPHGWGDCAASNTTSPQACVSISTSGVGAGHTCAFPFTYEERRCPPPLHFRWITTIRRGDAPAELCNLWQGRCWRSSRMRIPARSRRRRQPPGLTRDPRLVQRSGRTGCDIGGCQRDREHLHW